MIVFSLDFQVNDSLPNVTFPLTHSFARNLPVNRPGHNNDTLFFWGFEKENGSLTSNGSTDPWIIWLQGGYVTCSNHFTVVPTWTF